MQVTFDRKGKITIKHWKRELEQLHNMIGMMRYLERAGDAEMRADCKGAADNLEKVRARFTEEAAT